MTLVFIDLLKAFAAVLITNSHLADVWPISAIASGGMLGNVLFFAVSGYCLTMPNRAGGGIHFLPWYGKRIRRIYVSVWLIELVQWMIAGQLPTASQAFKYFIFPTRYHFVASIMILYIVFYLVQLVMERWKVPLRLIVVAYVIGITVFYLLVYDRSYTHVDVVEEPFIRCLFFGAMLMGMYFRQKESHPASISGRTVAMLGFTTLYFASKIILSHYESLHDAQILTWVTILLALYFIFDWAQGLELTLSEHLPAWIKKALHFVASLTLQIYLVQFLVIDRVSGLPFPLNLGVIVIGILAAAEVLHLVDSAIQNLLFKRTRRVGS